MKATVGAAVRKTNAMRELDVAGIAYRVISYSVDESDLSGIHVADQLGEDKNQVFKTLVTVATSGSYVVCCIPVAEELDLKAAARVAHEKSLAMVHVKDLLGITGYIRGGCSPVGMKRRFPVIIDETCMLFDRIMISGGRRGVQLHLDSEELIDFLGAQVADICMKEKSHGRR